MLWYEGIGLMSVVYNESWNGTNEDIIVLCQATKSSDVTLGKERQLQESEQERKIRLGEMTPFGSVLGNQQTSAGR
jgi:hypothetical protein